MDPASAARPALIFIPDISGFTRFVNTTEILHAKHIVEELLEVLLDANEIGLELSEIEGDALLMYRFGPAPTPAELLAQVQRMYIRFHAHLKKYETHRICSCGACTYAHEMTVKFVAHYGEIVENRIKDRHNLFGKELIVAHRLLKNEIEWDEYALFTDDLTRAHNDWNHLNEFAWSEVRYGQEEYDFGRAHYGFLSLEALRSQVPEPRVEDYGLPEATQQVLYFEKLVEAPIDLVFNVLSDLSFRHEWMVGLKGSDQLNHKWIQDGATHRCIINGNEKDPFFVAHGFELSKDKITFVESDYRESISSVYTLHRVSPGLTRIELHFLMKPHFFKKLLFDLFLKRKLQRLNEQNISNFRTYCKKLQAEGRKHPHRIVLPESAAALRPSEQGIH